jgi:predicted lipase
MDLQLTIQAANFVLAAEALAPKANHDGKIYYGHAVIQTIYSNDLATDISPNIDPIRDCVSIGYVARSTQSPDDYVIAIRGTANIWEWIQDAKLLPKSFPFVSGAGLTEDGFTDMYCSFRTGVDPKSARLTPTLASLLGSSATTNLTICGHSLGAALATLLALDVVMNTPYTHPIVYTFASPRVGDLTFSHLFNSVVPGCFRIANRNDVVTHLPTPPLYFHVGDDDELIPGSSVANNVLCQHHLTTYLFLLDKGATPLNAECVPK